MRIGSKYMYFEAKYMRIGWKNMYFNSKYVKIGVKDMYFETKYMGIAAKDEGFESIRTKNPKSEIRKKAGSTRSRVPEGAVLPDPCRGAQDLSRGAQTLRMRVRWRA